MANLNNNDRNRGGYFDRYVNFDQFLMQHNINNCSPMNGQSSGNGQSPNSYNSNSHNSRNGGFNFNGESSGSRPPNWAPSSNLTPTASEFVPQFTSNAASSSSLHASASEFVPRNYQGSDKKSPKNYTQREPRQSNTVSCDKNDRKITKANDDTSSKTDSVIDALSKTHISERNHGESRPLNSSGGAIKKVRSQDYRNDSRERHSNGEFQLK